MKRDFRGVITLDVVFEPPKNMRVLRLQGIEPLDKPPKTWGIYLGRAPLNYYSLVAFWHSDLAVLNKVCWEVSQKLGRDRHMMEF